MCGLWILCPLTYALTFRTKHPRVNKYLTDKQYYELSNIWENAEKLNSLFKKKLTRKKVPSNKQTPKKHQRPRSQILLYIYLLHCTKALCRMKTWARHLPTLWLLAKPQFFDCLPVPFLKDRGYSRRTTPHIQQDKRNACLWKLCARNETLVPKLEMGPHY